MQHLSKQYSKERCGDSSGESLGGSICCVSDPKLKRGQGLVHRSFSAVLYATGSKALSVVNVTLYPWVEDATYVGASNYFAEELDVRRWFPGGAYSLRFDRLPGTAFRFPHGFRVFATMQPEQAPVNLAVRNHLGRIWTGNVLVVCHGRQDPTSLIHHRCEDVTIVQALLVQ